MPLTQVLDERSAESRFAATRAPLLTPFVGREQEIGLLLDRWHLARGGEGQVVVLSGEAGIGKSRISEVLREQVGDAGIRIRYQCSPYYTDTALYPVAAQLRAAAQIEPDDPPATKLDKLERLLVPLEAKADASVPLARRPASALDNRPLSGPDDGAGIAQGADPARAGRPVVRCGAAASGAGFARGCTLDRSDHARVV